MRSKLRMVGELARLGVRNVGRNARRSLITGTMIALAVTNVIFFKGYAMGIERLLVNMAVEGKAGAIQVQRKGYLESQDLGSIDLDLADHGPLSTTILGLENVKAVAPRLLFTGLVSNGDTSTMFLGLAVDPVLETKVCPSGPGLLRAVNTEGGLNPIISGTALTEPTEESVLLTDALATELNVKVGDSLNLFARTQAGSMDSVDLTVKGIFHYDDPMGNRAFGVIPLAVAQRLLHMESRATALAISVNDPSRIEATAQLIRDTLRDETSAVFSWSQLAPYFRDVASLQDGMLGIVFGVVVLLVIAGIINTMMMSTFERKREIGMLMSMGFRRWSIVVLFMVEAAWLAALSGGLGLVLGAAAVKLTHQAGIDFSVPGGASVLTRPELRLDVAVGAVIGAIISALLASLVPAWRASRLQPIEALRSD